MLEADEDAVVCDLAETYHILDYKSLPVLTVATLVCGLRANSRIKQKINDAEYQLDEVLLAHIADRLGLVLCMLARGKMTKPPSLVDMLLGKNIKNDGNDEGVVSFSSPDEFELMRQAIINA